MAAPGRTPPRRSPGRPDELPGSRDEETARQAARHSLLFSLLLLGALLSARLPLPWTTVGFLFTVVALVVGAMGLAAALQVRRRGTAAVLAGGLVLALVVLLTQAVSLATWRFQQERLDCLSGAVTDQARARCETALREGVTDWLEGMAPVGAAG